MIRGWLSSVEGHARLQAFCATRLRYIEEGGYSLRGLAPSEHSAEGGELAQEFALYLLDRVDDRERCPELARMVDTGNYRGFLNLTWAGFVNNLAERDRSRRYNPRGYLYRRFREFFKGTEHFSSMRSADGCLWFGAPGQGTGTITASISSCSDDWGSWPVLPTAPGVTADGQLTVSSVWLEETAGHFLNVALERCPGNGWFAVRDLVAYIAALHPWLGNPSTVELDPESPDGDDVSREQGFEARRQIKMIGPLARQLVAGWERLESCVFAWRLEEPPRTLQDIARLLGLPDHNRVYSIYQKTLRDIKSFSSSWPGPPLADLEPEVAAAFLDRVVVFAKKRCDRP